ncbi:MAG: 2-dehydropantoate 2-reductase [Akkermansia sp.]|nr:2-dehydropantoate 2-reductase [Akkermansia sp.]
MKIVILGAGALGCYYGAKLAAAGEDVSFIMRSACEPVRRDGLFIRSGDGDIVLKDVRAYASAREAGKADLIALTWKSTANTALAGALPALIGENTRLITLQNGMGNAETAARYMPPERIFIGLCFICAMMPEPGKIIHLEGGDMQFAPFVPSTKGTQEAEEFARLFRRAGLRTQAFGQPEQIQWCKLAWNIPFNGLCLAHGGISIEQLFSLPDQVERAECIMREVCLAAEMRGFPPPREIVRKQMERTTRMGAFIPSSAVDYLKKRPIEYDAIWGAPLEKAHEVNAPVPHWEQLCRDIRARMAPEP